ncbi:hypothetical protein K491DRAFT_720526 [Lophiostoma macrostomum CBS 122681]|uniref:Uncharacterized protein n=1 Tax=Lophiostoma macrostomum CBS 122681 TaxID=1314788 RepID=A0A6A6SSA9_9PLEO|nr:hypothetical protein K491DRAFT_720526 [Lophiostoma macrostomum CBS 122681]
MSGSESTVEDPDLYKDMTALRTIGTNCSKGIGTMEESVINQQSHLGSSDANGKGKCAKNQEIGPSSPHDPSGEMERDALVDNLRRELAYKTAKIRELEQEISRVNQILSKMSDWLDDTGNKCMFIARNLNRKPEDYKDDHAPAKKRKNELV